MTDCFALFDEPRRPWLDADALKARFLTLSATVHPDRVHGASEAEKLSAHRRYTELNTAYNCLREPRERLRHLLELETGARPQEVQKGPAAAMDLFLEVGQLCRDVDGFLTARARVFSPLLKAQLFERGLEWTDQLQELQGRIHAQQEPVMAELKSLNAAWEAPASKRPLARLEEIYRIYSYLARWTAQIQERIVQLSL